MTPSSVSVLVSGGLDSAVLVAELGHRYRRVFPIFVRQGLAWESAELFWLRKFLRAIRRPGLQPLFIMEQPMTDLYGAHWSVTGRGVPGGRTPDHAVYLPGRNLILLGKAAIYCSLKGIQSIALGSLGHNPFPDASPAFFRLIGRALSQALRTSLSVEAPYRKLQKSQVIARGRDLPLQLSFSCISPRGRKHCGRCNKCAERRTAFRRAGVIDPTVYASR